MGSGILQHVKIPDDKQEEVGHTEGWVHNSILEEVKHLSNTRKAIYEFKKANNLADENSTYRQEIYN